MKLLTISLLAVAVLLFVSGCAGESGYYTSSQVAAQHGGYDPTSHTYGSRY